MRPLGKESEMSDEMNEKLAQLVDDTPIELFQGNVNSKKNITKLPEDYEALAERLTGDMPLKGTGRVLRGAEAAAYGRAMLEESVGGPEKLAELIEELKKRKD